MDKNESQNVEEEIEIKSEEDSKQSKNEGIKEMLKNGWNQVKNKYGKMKAKGWWKKNRKERKNTSVTQNTNEEHNQQIIKIL